MLDSISQEKIRNLVPAAVSLAVAMMTPYALSYTFEPFDQIYVLKAYALLWIHTSNVLPTILWWPYGIINNTVGSVFRLLFVYEIYRCYKKRTDRERAVAVGIVSELWTFQFFFFSNILYPSSIGWYNIPVPLLFITGLLFLVLLPPRKAKGLWNEETDTSHSQS
ncbi:hypothetical protein EU537_00670 [Candidatus Thorarchaeota archaeon]|nr:MAG: hypothetical protein EU537_00670 [Candidatus Thorarchaeota archaeon]